MKCSECKDNACYIQEKVCHNLENDCLKKYEDPADNKALEVSSKLEADYYCKLTRIEEVIKYCEMMNYKKIGIAFCVGLSEETKVIAEIFSQKFSVSSVCCKNGSIDKERLNLAKIQEGRFEATCNPIGQALVFNQDKTDLNIIIGLCVGHDILFTQHSNAPVTTLVVKDRILAHNPLGAINSKYHRRKWAL